MTSTDRITLLHLVIGKDSSESRTPVHRRLTLISDPVIHQDCLLLLFVHGIPLLCTERLDITTCSIDRRAAALSERRFKFFYRTSLLLDIVIPACKHLQECPLSPLVIFRIACTYLA